MKFIDYNLYYLLIRVQVEYIYQNAEYKLGGYVCPSEQAIWTTTVMMEPMSSPNHIAPTNCTPSPLLSTSTFQLNYQDLDQEEW